MMMFVLAIVLVALCGLTFRIRGGVFAGTGIKLSGNLSRLTFALAAALTTCVFATWWLALASIPTWFIACTFPLFGGIDLGQRDGTKLQDWAALALRGLLWTVLPALVLYWPEITLASFHIEGHGVHGWWILLLAGPFMPLLYWLGQRSGIRAPYIGQIDWQQTGELFYGIWLGASIIVACMN